ncbi:MAG: V-type ATP synthase subunit I [Candidatus Altiarchaeota archaeon]
MCRLECLLGKEFKDDLVAELHSRGVVEIEFLDDNFLGENKVSRDVPLQRVSIVSDLILRARRVTEFLSVYGKDTGFVDDLLVIEKIDRLMVREFSFDELIKNARDVVNPAEEALNYFQSKANSLESRIGELKNLVEKYSPFTGFDFSSENFEESPHLHTVVGLLPNEAMLRLEENLSKKFGMSFILLCAGERENSTVVVVVVMKRDSASLDEILRMGRFGRLLADMPGKFDDAVHGALSEIDRLSKERVGMDHLPKKMCREYYARLFVAMELLEIEKQRCEVFTNFGSTENTIFMRFWTPLNKADEVEEMLRKKTMNQCAIARNSNPDDAPVLLNNPIWLKPFEELTRMFSTPKYNQLDPTILLAPTFVLFFGMMFSDFVYGAFLLMLAYILYKKYNAYSSSIKDFSIILTCFGFSSMLFGLLTGSFLGDFVGKYILGSEKGSQAIALWLDPLYNGNMMVYLLVVFAIGFIHLYVGYTSGFLDSLRRKEYKTAILDYLTLMVIPIGFILYVAKGSTAALLLSLISLVLLFIGSGIMGLYMKVSGILGSVVSYARLLALMVSSSGIAMAVNFMTYLSLSIPYVGILLAPMVFVGGHLVNFALNMLGSFVHTLRLHYVEFFGTFYEGGGVEFKPFMEKRRYSILINEEVK